MRDNLPCGMLRFDCYHIQIQQTIKSCERFTNNHYKILAMSVVLLAYYKHLLSLFLMIVGRVIDRVCKLHDVFGCTSIIDIPKMHNNTNCTENTIDPYDKTH